VGEASCYGSSRFLCQTLGMPTDHMLALLIAEREKLDQALGAGVKRRGRPLGSKNYVAPVLDGNPWPDGVVLRQERSAVMALRDSTVIVKADAVKALAQYGSAAAVWEAFRYWHEWWKNLPSEMNEENRRFEQVFLEATRHARNGSLRAAIWRRSAISV
jgi:hypothetical protein